TPKAITAIFVGLQTKMATFQVQRHINDYRKEPLLAILPGIALTDLWQITRTMENTLQLIAALVLLSSLLGLSTLLLSSIRERQREIAVLRAIGARPSFVFWMIELEALLITLSGIALALIALVMATQSAQTVLAENYGLFITPFTLNPAALTVLGIIIISALLLATIPALSAYRVSLHAGLALKQ
ncbi:MAG TPA: FtsX-like permease family protein, partial [Nitrosomonas sp.]|nr:FtsX-like permease family protein [Nitrosomonas sp.]